MEKGFKYGAKLMLHTFFHHLVVYVISFAASEKQLFKFASCLGFNDYITAINYEVCADYSKH